MYVFAANPLQPLINFFEQILIWFHDLGIGWGMAIVCMTLLIRVLLLPLTLKQFKSMQNMVRFQPEIKRLQEKYKNDRERLNQEMMKFYRENKVNPFASCLPLVAQLPVFLALFYMLQDDLRLDICPDINPAGTTNPQPCGDGGEASFLFIPDLTDKATGGVLVALIVLYVGSQLLSTILMSTATDRTQRIIFLALPFVFVIFVINFPAGLLVYWITTNLWTSIQQYIVRRTVGPIQPATSGGAGGGGGGDGGGGLLSGLRPKPPSGGGDQANGAPAAKEREKVAAGPPPPPPRKKKKRSGRRR